MNGSASSPLDKEEHPLQLGESFERRPKASFHTIRCERRPLRSAPSRRAPPRPPLPLRAPCPAPAALRLLPCHLSRQRAPSPRSPSRRAAPGGGQRFPALRRSRRDCWRESRRGSSPLMVLRGPPARHDGALLSPLCSAAAAAHPRASAAPSAWLPFPAPPPAPPPPRALSPRRVPPPRAARGAAGKRAWAEALAGSGVERGRPALTSVLGSFRGGASAMPPRGARRPAWCHLVMAVWDRRPQGPAWRLCPGRSAAGRQPRRPRFGF